MKTFAFLSVAVSASLLLIGAPTVGRERVRTFQRENVLGTSFELKVSAASADAASRAETAALGEIEREGAILSSWNADSEFSRWFRTRGQAVAVSPELFEVLSTFDTWRTRTGGALDAAAEAVSRAWKFAASEGRTPGTEELESVVAAVRQPHWKLDPAARTATHLSDTPLALNSFVKSYIMDHAIDAALRTPGVTAAVLNIGGDLVIRGALPGVKGTAGSLWTEAVNVADPRSDAENSAPLERLLVSDRAVATSGGYRRGFDIAGHHYSHIVDPRSGQATSHVLSATVIAPRPVDAGALATAACVLTPEETRRLAAATPGADFLLITAEGGRIASPGWRRYEAVRPALTAAARPEPSPSPAPQFADEGMELSITLQLAHNGKRPYVAVWIENMDKFPVRTLALWYQKPRWLPDLRNWYREDRMRAKAEGNDITASVASATRPPGKYSLNWDGKDQAGKPVKPGKYTVNIEAAREHGTYQIMRQEVEFDGKPKQFQLTGNQEISSANIDYRKAAH
jgi:thiamine biosynthesis lipoprotein